MRFNLSLDRFRRCVPNSRSPETWFEQLRQHLPRFQIDTIERVAGFISQCQHESNDFNNLQENLNYSWQGLRSTFPRHFTTDTIAQEYHRQPQRIANRVYANRMSNGDETSGDGWSWFLM